MRSRRSRPTTASPPTRSRSPVRTSTGATAVKFSTTDATSFKVEDDGHVAAVAPAGNGTLDVTMTTADKGATSATSDADKFTYRKTGSAPEPTAHSAADPQPTPAPTPKPTKHLTDAQVRKLLNRAVLSAKFVTVPRTLVFTDRLPERGKARFELLLLKRHSKDKQYIARPHNRGVEGLRTGDGDDQPRLPRLADPARAPRGPPAAVHSLLAQLRPPPGRRSSARSRRRTARAADYRRERTRRGFVFVQPLHVCGRSCSCDRADGRSTIFTTCLPLAESGVGLGALMHVALHSARALAPVMKNAWRGRSAPCSEAAPARPGLVAQPLMPPPDGPPLDAAQSGAVTSLMYS